MNCAGIPFSVPPAVFAAPPQALVEHLRALPGERAAVLRRRLEHEWPRLVEGLSLLYGHRADFEAWLTTLVQHTLDAAQARESALWTLDLQREADPAWHQRGLTGYCAYVDRFADSLAGVEQRIAYLRELGVDYLHLLPFLKAGAPPNDGGFAVAGFDEVEPALGTMATLRHLCRQLRRHGISLCSDLVLNHVAQDHPWARAARAGEARYLPYFHWCHSASEVAAWERDLGQVFPSTAPGNFSYVEERQAWVWTTFYPYQWDLNYSHPPVFAAMAAALLNLANHGVEVFRLDSTGYLWKRAGSHCTNQPEVHRILQALRSLCAIAAPGVLLKAEAIMPTHELPPYFGLGPVQGPECHLAYHSSLMAASWLALTEEDPQVIEQVLRHTPTLPCGASWLSYVRCHDDIGWNVLRPELPQPGADATARLDRAAGFLAGEPPGSYARGARFQTAAPGRVHGSNGMSAALVGLQAGLPPEHPAQQAALRRLELMFSLSFFVGGLPLIYMGDELGQDNTPGPEIEARAGTDGRELQRPRLDETALAQRHQPGTVAQHVFSMLQALIRQRRDQLPQGVPVRIEVLPSPRPGLLVLRRAQVIGLFNFSARPCALERDELPPQAWPAATTVALPGHGCRWLSP